MKLRVAWLRSDSSRGEWSRGDRVRGYRICSYNDTHHAGVHVHHLHTKRVLIPSVPIRDARHAEAAIVAYASHHDHFDAHAFLETLHED